MGARATRGLGFQLLAMISGCAITPAHPDAYSFAVLDDTPCSAVEERSTMWMIDDLNRLDLAFVFKEVGEIHFSDRSSLGAWRLMLGRSFLRIRKLAGSRVWRSCQIESHMFQ